jgi:hypothetical protein
VMEPTFRAGILRRDAIEEATRLGGGGVPTGSWDRDVKAYHRMQAYQAKLRHREDALTVTPERLATRWKSFSSRSGMRSAPISIGIPILLPMGNALSSPGGRERQGLGGETVDRHRSQHR